MCSLLRTNQFGLGAAGVVFGPETFRPSFYRAQSFSFMIGRGLQCVAVIKELKVSHYKKETQLFSIGPYYGKLALRSLRAPQFKDCS